MDEYIEREATIKRIKEVYCVGCNSYHGVRCRACGTGDAIDIIEDAPATDVAPVVHGRWEWFEEWYPSTPGHPMECEDYGWRCGECKTALEDMVGGCWDDPDDEPKLNYCPKCGAMMEGGDGDEDS